MIIKKPFGKKPFRADSSRPDQNSKARGPRFKKGPQKTPQEGQAIKTEQVGVEFEKLWKTLFESPVHLDSALSKLKPRYKSILAQIVPLILLKPVSLAQELGIGVSLGEPWSLPPEGLAEWRPARLMAERLYEMMSFGLPSVKGSVEDYPPAMVQAWTQQFGDSVAHHLANALAESPPLSLRARRGLTAQGLVQTLKKECALSSRIDPSNFAPFGVRLGSYAPVMKTKVYEDCGFEIQDEGSQWMSLFALWPNHFGPLLTATPASVDPALLGKGKVEELRSLLSSASLVQLGEGLGAVPAVIIDACSGAGGKALAMSDALGGRCKFFAYDVSDKKLQALRRRAVRAGLNNIKTVNVELLSQEGKGGLSRFEGMADLVLVDAPCSGWGVLRRNPDIKWRQKADALQRMPGVQLEVLKSYAPGVKKGGRLVFGVCTFRAEETSGTVASFLELFPEFQVEHRGYLGPDPSDGFYMCSFKRAR